MKKRSIRRQKRQSGFTLMEVLLVLVILVILSSLAVGFFRNTRNRAFVNSAKSQVGLLEGAIDRYELDMADYPQQLQDLRVSPDGSENWSGPYLKKEIPNDPWGNPYQYQVENTDTNSLQPYRIWSWGPDRSDGTEDDISNDQQSTNS